MKRSILWAATVAFSLCNGAVALAQMQNDSHGMAVHEKKIAVENAWARASVGDNGAAFITVVNRGNSDDKLIAAKSSVTPRVELHTHIMKGNVMEMREIDAIPIPAGKSVTLKPGGMHIMLIGLKKKLVKGKTFPLTLVFAKAGEVTVSVPIKSIGAMGSGAMGGMGNMGGMGHGGMGSGNMGSGNMGSGNMKH